jgi:hypothetical protein
VQNCNDQRDQTHLPVNEYRISRIGGQISPGRTIAAEGCRGVELGRGKKEMVISVAVTIGAVLVAIYGGVSFFDKAISYLARP